MRPAAKARILFVTRTSERTGPTNSLLQLITHLRVRFEPHVLLPGWGEFTDLLQDLDVPFSSFRSLRKSRLPAMVKLMKRERFDLVYGNETSSGAKNALIAAKLLGRPFVYHVRAMGHDGSWRKVGFLRFADAVIAVSEATARSIRPYVRTMPEVVHNGVPAAPDEPTRQTARALLAREFSFPADATVLTMVGNVHPRKGQEFAIRALRELTRTHPSVHLLMAGRLSRDPSYTARMRDLIRELELEDRARLLGFRHDVWTVLRASDVFVHAAVEDPHPRAVVEAMAAGLPVVAADVDGVAETVLDARSGFLVPAHDHVRLSEAIVRLVEDPDLRQEFGRTGRTRASHEFSAARSARRVGDILDATLAGRRVSVRIPRDAVA